ncbi:MAG: TIR domain-containing protein [Bacteroidales bacterium]|nr:TIR domain-containing protein [Bacteroidales bacterium]
MAHDVFLSYSSLDKTDADNVCSILEQNGISCWMAPRDITPGLDFAEAIIDGIKSSKIFVLIYSSNSNTSTQVIREVDRAVHNGLPVINLRLEDVPLSKQLEYYLSSVHWLDAVNPPLEEHINKLSKVVKILLGKDEAKDNDIEKAIRDGTLQVGKAVRAITKARQSLWKKALFPVAFFVIILVTAFLIITPLLKRKLTSEAAAMNKSIAVLPFKYLSDDPEKQYLADGMMEAIQLHLSKIKNLNVIAGSSVERYRKTDKAPGTICKELGVEYLLEGSFQKFGDAIRLIVGLKKAGKGSNEWANQYDRKWNDILSVQSEVAQTIAKELNAIVTPGEKQIIEKISTKNLDAYEAVLKGNFYLNKFTKNDLDTAMKYFELAKEKDPKYVLAYDRISAVWAFRQQVGFVSPLEALPKIKESLMKAVELDSTINLAGYYVYTMWDWEKGEKEYKKAIELNPNDAGSRATYSLLLCLLGRNEEALKQMEVAAKLDPLNPLRKIWHGEVLMFAHRFDEAIKVFQDILKIEGDYPLAHLNLRSAFHLSGKYNEALKQYKLWVENDTELVNALEKGDIEGGYKGALLEYNKVVELRFKNSYWPPMDIASNYAFVGEKDKAFYWLEHAYKLHDPALPFILYPFIYDYLHNDPRFQDLCKRMKLPYK